MLSKRKVLRFGFEHNSSNSARNSGIGEMVKVIPLSLEYKLFYRRILKHGQQGGLYRVSIYTHGF